MRRFLVALALCLLLDAAPTVDAKKKNKDKAAKGNSGADRMNVELDASGQQGGTVDAEMAAHEREALAGMEASMNDALTDIMAVLLHGSETSRNPAIARLIDLAIASGNAGTVQARKFRSAVVSGGALPSIIAGLESTEPQSQHLCASAIHALAIDDPTTDEDNFHQLEICQNGAVPPLVKLLSTDHSDVQTAATGALTQLAENPTCQQMIAGEGAVAPLLSLATFGNDGTKLGAMNALDVLETNNDKVRQELLDGGAQGVLSGISSMGSSLLREQAGLFNDRLSSTEKPAGKISPEAQVASARKTRIRYDGVRNRAMQMMRGWEEGHTAGRGHGSPVSGRGGPPQGGAQMGPQ